MVNSCGITQRRYPLLGDTKRIITKSGNLNECDGIPIMRIVTTTLMIIIVIASLLVHFRKIEILKLVLSHPHPNQENITRIS